MEEYLFVVKFAGVSKNGNSLWHIYAAWRYIGDNRWRNFSPIELKELGLGRVVREEYITANEALGSIVEKLEDIYEDCSFLFL